MDEYQTRTEQNNDFAPFGIEIDLPYKLTPKSRVRVQATIVKVSKPIFPVITEDDILIDI